MAQLSFVIFSEQEEFGAALRAMVEATGHAHVAEIACDRERLRHALRTHRPDALFADLGSVPHDVLDALDAIPAPRPTLLVCGPQTESQLILRAMRQGAREFLPAIPEAEAVREAVHRLALDHAPAVATGRMAPVLGVMGAKGGVGATVVACQLAATLQRMGARTVLVDLNLPLGDVALHFDVRPVYTLAQLAREAGAVDATYLRGLLHSHRSGVQILAATAKVEDAELVQGAHVERALGLLREEFDWVVVDVSRSWSEASVRALDLVSQILLVTCLDVPTLRHTREHVELLKRLGHSESKLHLIANRYARSNPVSERDFEHFVGQPLEARIPNDYATTAASVNEGRTVEEIDSGGALHLSYQNLAREAYRWCDLEPPETAPRSLLARVRRKIGKRAHGTA